MDKVTVVIPVVKGRDWDQTTDRSPLRLPDSTPYVVAVHDDPGEWASAMNQAVEVADTDLVILGGPTTWFEKTPEAVELLADLCWDVDVTYGNFVQWIDGQPYHSAPGEQFCPHRLRLENYLPPYACVRKSKFLEVGGMTTGYWDLWNRMLDAGARFKYVPEAISARDGVYEDASEAPTPSQPQATFYYQSTPGTAYWRCMVPARHLPGQAMFNLPKRGVQDGRLVLPNHHGAAVFQFAGNLEHLAIIRYMQGQGIRVLLEVDDTYLHWHPQYMKRAGWNRDMDGGPGFSVECHRRTAEVVDGVICTTDLLAKQYRKLNPNVFVCGNQIDPADWAEPEKPDDGKFRIGWFASASHREDGLLPYRALEWASAQPDVEVVMIGTGVAGGIDKDTKQRTVKPLYKFPFKHIPWSNDFGVYRKFMQELDIGICPVKPTPWAMCRSDLKALEYGMAQAYPVVSDVPPYDTVDVPKAKTPKDWLRIIQQLVADRDGTRQKAREWREYVLANRTIHQNIHLWEAAVAG